MNLLTKKKSKISAISYRAAFLSSLILTALLLSILAIFGDLSDIRVAGGAIIFMVVTFAVVYGVSAWINSSRIAKLDSIVSNISKRKFDDQPVPARKKTTDELDTLIHRSLLASDTIRKELARLNKIENYRKEFIGDISHELKTPIFAIQGFIETLIDGAIHDDEVNEVFLKKTMRNVNRLIYLTNDLMEISRLETGELKSNFKDVYLRDIVLDVVESLQYKAQKEDIEIRVKDFDKNIQIRADRNQIKQVLINLIENGMKYNKPGGFVEVGVTEYKLEKGKLLLTVKDSGIGIDKKDINRVTERFFRVDKSRSREKGGTGLGLAIVKHIVEAHGEKLIINSEPERGSSFSITFSRAGYFSD